MVCFAASPYSSPTVSSLFFHLPAGGSSVSPVTSVTDVVIAVTIVLFNGPESGGGHTGACWSSCG